MSLKTADHYGTAACDMARRAQSLLMRELAWLLRDHRAIEACGAYIRIAYFQLLRDVDASTVCSKCGSPYLRLIDRDSTADSETGYRDDSDYYHCQDCGAETEAIDDEPGAGIGAAA